MITLNEYMALTQQKYQQLAALQDKDSFYDHEKEFAAIWRDLGQQVLEKTISKPPKDRRKKKQ